MHLRADHRDRHDLFQGTGFVAGFVDAHAEGDGGDHDHPFLAQEFFLVLASHGSIQSGVIRQGIPALLFQPGCGLFHFLARQAIHDASVIGVLGFEEGLQLFARVVLECDAVTDVGAVKAGDELGRIFQRQPLDDLAARRRIRRGGEGDARHAVETFVQHRQRAVFGTEVVSPLRDTMRFVDGEQGDIIVLLQTLQLVQKSFRHQPFGRDIQQLQFAAHELPRYLPRLFRLQAGIQERGRHTELFERIHLVLHQCDQGRHDDADARTQQGRNLVAQRLAAAGWHQHQRIAAAYDMLDDSLLCTTK